jgi:hypothetical protein
MRDMTLVLRQHLKQHNWLACAEDVCLDSTLVGAQDSIGMSLLSYAVRDERWLEGQWLLDNGWGWVDVEKVCSKYSIDFSAVPGPWLDRLMLSDFDGLGWTFLLSLVRSGLINESLEYIKAACLQKKDWLSFWSEYVSDFDVRVANKIFLATENTGGGDALVEIALAGVRKNRWDMLGWSYGLGLDIEQLDGAGESVLGVAVKLNRVDMVDWILSTGAPVDMFDGNGHTALYLAVASGSFDCIKYLLDSGAKSDLRQGKNGQGNSPLRLAQKSTRSAVRSKVVQDFELEVLSRMTKVSNVSTGSSTKRL